MKDFKVVKSKDMIVKKKEKKKKNHSKPQSTLKTKTDHREL